jgi:hypothetical protein
MKRPLITFNVPTESIFDIYREYFKTSTNHVTTLVLNDFRAVYTDPTGSHAVFVEYSSAMLRKETEL